MEMAELGQAHRRRLTPAFWTWRLQGQLLDAKTFTEQSQAICWNHHKCLTHASGRLNATISFRSESSKTQLSSREGFHCHSSRWMRSEPSVDLFKHHPRMQMPLRYQAHFDLSGMSGCNNPIRCPSLKTNFWPGTQQVKCRSPSGG